VVFAPQYRAVVNLRTRAKLVRQVVSLQVFDCCKLVLAVTFLASMWLDMCVKMLAGLKCQINLDAALG
jgi:hypothetical protein